MNTQYGVLIRFVLLYAGLFSAFGLVSPFLPAFLGARGLRAEELGMLLGAGTAVRLLCGPLAGRLADRFHIFRAELAIFCVLAATAALLYFAVDALWMVVAVSLFQAAALAPLVPLADALSLAHARVGRKGKPGAFEYGWVRGAGSAAFVAGTLLAGQVAGSLRALRGHLAGRGLPACNVDRCDPRAGVPRGSRGTPRCRECAGSLACAVSPAGIRTRRR